MSEAVVFSPNEIAERIIAHPGSSPLSHEAIRVQLERILNSKAFARSPRISRFLSFVVDQTLDTAKKQAEGVPARRGSVRPVDTSTPGSIRLCAWRPAVSATSWISTTRRKARTIPFDIQFRKGCYVPTFAEKRAGDGEGEPGDVRTSAPSKTRMLSRCTRAAVIVWAGGPPMGSQKPCRASPTRWPRMRAARALSRAGQRLDVHVLAGRDAIARRGSKSSALRPPCASHCAAMRRSPFDSRHRGCAVRSRLDGWRVKLRKGIHANPCDPAARLWYGLYLTLAGRPRRVSFRGGRPNRLRPRH